MPYWEHVIIDVHGAGGEAFCMKYSLLTAQGQACSRYPQLPREKNLKIAFDLIRSQRCTSRTELVRTMHLSTTAISSIVDSLIEDKLIVETGPMYTTQPGRRPMHLSLNSSARQMVTFSLNAQFIRYTLCDLESNILEDFQIAPPKGTDPEADSGHAFAQVFEDVLLRRSKIFDRDSAIAVCISFPGIYLAEKEMFTIRSAMNVSFSEESMRQLEQRLGVPLFFANNTMCLAYAEKKHLDSTQDTREMIFVNVSDGIGAGIIVDGNLLTGTYNTPGEIGHISVASNGIPCPCGNNDCLERYVNFEAILRRVRTACEDAGIRPPMSFSQITTDYLSLPPVIESLDKTAQYLAKGIYALICITGIQHIIIGGGIEVLGDPFLQSVIRHVNPHKMLTSHLTLSYASSGKEREYVGITQYFLDKAFVI